MRGNKEKQKKDILYFYIDQTFKWGRWQNSRGVFTNSHSYFKDNSCFKDNNMVPRRVRSSGKG